MIENPKNESAEIEKSNLLSEMVFEGMQRAFAKAKHTHPDKVFESSFTLADQLVGMRIAGRGLAETMNLVFAHLRVNGKHIYPPRLTIELWDQSETGIPSRVVSTRDDLYLHPVFMCSDDGRYVIHQLQYSMTCFDRKAGHIIGCISSIEELSLYEMARPLRVPLTIWHNDQDIPIIHAGLVAKNSQGVLFSGLSGAGKTTSAIACLCAGFSFLSEDLVGLQILPNGPCLGHSIYSSSFLNPDHLMHFPTLKPYAIKSRYQYEDKLLILPSQVFPLRLERVTTLSAVALPRIVNTKNSAIRRASKGEALLILGPSSLLGVPASPGVRGFNKLAELVTQVPCYWLELGNDLEEIPHCVEEILADATRF
jgi:hypothetical protein